MGSTESKLENIDTCARLVAEAAGRGARIVLLPEKWNALGSPEVLLINAEELEDGLSVAAMVGWARQHRIVLVGGSITERAADGRLFNTSMVFDETGAVRAVYRKIHMFDANVGGHEFRESASEAPGAEIVTCDVGGWRLGLSICYDVRFPELYRILALRGAQLLTVPANFTLFTGRDHWELLLRARAVEDQCFVLAAGQLISAATGPPSHGRSMIIDPWGVVMAQASDREMVVLAEVDPRLIADVREKVPALANRRPLSYAWPTEATEPGITFTG
ncbi:MAG: deaminated glutathione amidase [Solirubrobacteraceae bacterium]|nr:deaminated glutathione amidase [Solirubrobacteraceae bacterium]